MLAFCAKGHYDCSLAQNSGECTCLAGFGGPCCDLLLSASVLANLLRDFGTWAAAVPLLLPLLVWLAVGMRTRCARSARRRAHHSSAAGPSAARARGSPVESRVPLLPSEPQLGGAQRGQTWEIDGEIDGRRLSMGGAPWGRAPATSAPFADPSAGVGGGVGGGGGRMAAYRSERSVPMARRLVRRRVRRRVRARVVLVRRSVAAGRTGGARARPDHIRIGSTKRSSTSPKIPRCDLARQRERAVARRDSRVRAGPIVVVRAPSCFRMCTTSRLGTGTLLGSRMMSSEIPSTSPGRRLKGTQVHSGMYDNGQSVSAFMYM